MRLVQLGDSEVFVPPLAVGAMFWGTRVPTPEAHDLLDYAVDHGARFVDTANNYAFWEPHGTGEESETCLGDWIAARRPAGRDRLMLATKVGARPIRDGAGTGDSLGLGRLAVLDQVAGSLRRLHTDHVDVLYAHIDDTRTPMAETIGVFQEVVDRGWARTIAASNLTASRLREAVTAVDGGPQYVALQNRFTYLQPTAGTDLGRQILLDEALQVVCRDHRITMVAYSTLLEGAYTRPDKPLPGAYQQPGTDHALTTLSTVAQELGLDAGQTTLAWLAQRDLPVVPVVGISRRSQIDSAVTAVDTPIPAQQLTALDDARRGVE